MFIFDIRENAIHEDLPHQIIDFEFGIDEISFMKDEFFTPAEITENNNHFVVSHGGKDIVEIINNSEGSVEDLVVNLIPVTIFDEYETFFSYDIV